MKAIKVKIYPKQNQATLLEKHFGCCRYIYNWGLNKKISHYQQFDQSLSKFNLMKELTQLKKEDETIWLKEVNAQALQQSLVDLDSAFSHFFRKNNQFPKFKSRKNPKQSYRVPQAFQVEIDKHYIKIPRLGWIKFKDEFNVPENAEFRNITISRKNSKYYAAISYKTPDPVPKKTKPTLDKTLGIDLGITDLAIRSDGVKTPNPKHLKQSEQQLKEAQQKLSSQEKGSKGYERTKIKLSNIHEKVANTRKDFLHKLTTSIVENQDYTSIAIEDLAVKQMEQSNYSPMSKAIGDAGWRMFRQMLEYKCQDRGKNLLVIGRFDPSSKTCSTCGNVYHELSRREKSWICEKCSASHDRDVNAAINIKTFGFRKYLEVGQDLWEA